MTDTIEGNILSQLRLVRLITTLKNRSDEVLLTLALVILWTQSEMWDASLWLQETARLNTASTLDGIFRSNAFSLWHVIVYFSLEVFGESEFPFRSLSLLFSCVLMLSIYSLTSLISDRVTANTASILFITSSYSINQSLLVAPYSFYSAIAALITYWSVSIYVEIRNKKGVDRNDRLLPLLASLGVIEIIGNEFLLMFLTLLFVPITYLLTKQQTGSIRERFLSITKLPLFPILGTYFLWVSIKLVGIISAISLVMVTGSNPYYGGSEQFIITTLPELLQIYLNHIDSDFSLIICLVGLVAILVPMTGLEFGFLRYKEIWLMLLFIFVVSNAFALFLQYKISNVLIERYLFFFYFLFCIIAALSMRIAIALPLRFADSQSSGKITVVLVLLILASYSTTVYDYSKDRGDVRGVAIYISDNVGNEPTSIISNIPVRTYAFYLKAHEIQVEDELGFWGGEGGFENESISEFDSRFVVLISLYNPNSVGVVEGDYDDWLYDLSVGELEDSGYELSDKKAFPGGVGGVVWIFER